MFFPLKFTPVKTVLMPSPNSGLIKAMSPEKTGEINNLFYKYN